MAASIMRDAIFRGILPPLGDACGAAGGRGAAWAARAGARPRRSRAGSAGGRIAARRARHCAARTACDAPGCRLSEARDRGADGECAENEDNDEMLVHFVTSVRRCSPKPRIAAWLRLRIYDGASRQLRGESTYPANLGRESPALKRPPSSLERSIGRTRIPSNINIVLSSAKIFLTRLETRNKSRNASLSALPNNPGVIVAFWATDGVFGQIE